MQNVPIEISEDASGLTNEIIKLIDTKTNEVKRTIWHRTYKSTGQVVYSGVYETSSLPNNQIHQNDSKLETHNKKLKEFPAFGILVEKSAGFR